MDYFEFPLPFDLVSLENSKLDDMFRLKDLQQRKLFLNDEIDMMTVEEIVKWILQYNADDKGVEPSERKPILLYLSSEGGKVEAGFQLIDVIENSKTPVYTINLGYWYSMGLIIGLSGHKRFATQNAQFLLHDGSVAIYNSSGKAADQAAFIKKQDERIKEYVLNRTTLTSKMYNKKYQTEWYMFADEALKYGFIDHIIGDGETTLDEVV